MHMPTNSKSASRYLDKKDKTWGEITTPGTGRALPEPLQGPSEPVHMDST